MDKRTFLALLLTALVIVVTPLMFPGARRQPTPPASAGAGDTGTKVIEVPPTQSAVGASTNAKAAPTPTSAQPVPAAPRVTAETTTVRDGVASFVMSSAGAAPVAVKIDDSVHKSLRAGEKGQGVTIAPKRGQLLHYQLVLGTDTIALDTIPFTREQSGSTITYRASGARPITIAYDFAPKG